MKDTPRTISRKIWSSLLALALAGLAIGLWLHFRGAHAGHDHGSHESTVLTLNDGKKWETDGPLRIGMQRIRDAAVPALAAQAKGQVAPDQAKATSAAIQENVNYLIANCKLPPKADATLHVLISDLLAGASLLTENPANPEGPARIASALRRYPEYFEHPGWRAATATP